MKRKYHSWSYTNPPAYPHALFGDDRKREMKTAIFGAFVDAFQVGSFTEREPNSHQVIPFCMGKKNWGLYGPRDCWDYGLRKYPMFDHTRFCQLSGVGSPSGKDETWPRMVISHPYLKASDVSEEEILRLVDPDDTGKVICEVFPEHYSFYYPGQTIMIVIADYRIEGSIEQMRHRFQNLVDGLYCEKGWEPT